MHSPTRLVRTHAPGGTKNKNDQKNASEMMTPGTERGYSIRKRSDWRSRNRERCATSVATAISAVVATGRAAPRVRLLRIEDLIVGSWTTVRKLSNVSR